jgi:hypothetical protein
MSRIPLAVVLLSITVSSGAAGAIGTEEPQPRLAVGTALPVLEGTFLSGRKAQLPETSRGKIALLALGFTYESRTAVEAWCKRFTEGFGKTPDVTFYEIPVIGGMARLARWFIDSGMRRGTPKEQHENVITIYGGVDPWKKRVGYKQSDDAYLILIDSQGTIRWLHSGPFDESKFTDLLSTTRLLEASR